MAKLVFHLANVPENEAQQVRQALDDAGIATFETSAGRWQIGVAGIWVRDDEDVQAARAIIDTIQATLGRGQAAPWWRPFVERPMISLVMLSLVVLVGAITLIPVWFLIS